MSVINQIRLSNNKSYAIFGAGGLGLSVMEQLIAEKIDIDCFYDNDESKWNTSINNIEVLSYQRHSSQLIIIASSYWWQIAQQMEKKGLKECRNYIIWPVLKNVEVNLTEEFVSYSNHEWLQLTETMIERMDLPVQTDMEPFDIMMQTTNRCTRECSWCWHGHNKEPQTKVMSDELFNSVVMQLKQFKNLNRFFFHDINEPLTDPDIIERVAIVRKVLPDVEINFISNADLLTYYNAKKLVKAGINKLSINLYDKRAEKGFDQRIANIKEIEVSIRKGDYSKEEWDNRAGQVTSIYDGAVGNCARPFGQMVILENGDVTLCCTDYSRTQIMGNAKDGLLNVWNSAKMQSIRNSLASYDRKGTICAKCSSFGLTR